MIFSSVSEFSVFYLVFHCAPGNSNNKYVLEVNAVRTCQNSTPMDMRHTQFKRPQVMEVESLKGRQFSFEGQFNNRRKGRHT